MKKKIIIGVFSVLVLFFLFLAWFSVTYSMGVVAVFEKGDKASNLKVLVVTQGSDFKKEVVKGVLEDEVFDTIYFKVIDATDLKTVEPADWNAIILIHTWEKFSPEKNTADFIEKYYDEKKMFVMATSAAGDNAIAGVNGITGASDLSKVETDVAEIKLWLVKVLKL
ncbi:hypothetical protein [Putridiphycobacter roseus]|nr:hypothetical protein [Putridiphycobacter roseus]